MRRWIALFCIAMAPPARGDEAVTAQREAEAVRLLKMHAASVTSDIGSFNRRNALCAREAAVAAAAYDATRSISFTRTIGWRWKAKTSRWVPDASDPPEVRLTYSGALRSGSETVGGQTLSFCRAEAPSELEGGWRISKGGNEDTWVGDSMILPKLDTSIAARETDTPFASAMTSPAERDARIAKARALLDAQAQRLAMRVAAGDAPKACGVVEGKGIGNKQYFSWNRGLRHDVAHGAWVDAGPSAPDVELKTATPWDGKAEMDKDCLAFRPVTLTARATWYSEGKIVLTFRLDLPHKANAP